MSHYLNIYVKGKRKIIQSVIQKKEWMTTILEISKPSSITPSSKKKKTEEIQRVSELCFMNICIIHFDRWILISFPRSFVSADYKRPVSIAMQATQEETIKGKRWAFKLGPFDCVTDWFQVRQLWEHQPEENCPSAQYLREAGRLHGWHGSPEFQYYTHVWWDF